MADEKSEVINCEEEVRKEPLTFKAFVKEMIRLWLLISLIAIVLIFLNSLLHIF